MRIANTLIAACGAALLLAGCTGSGLRGRGGPDEFAVTRNAPLVVPPDFALTPPRPGEPVPAAVDARGQALQALFGGPAARSASETRVLGEAQGDRAAEGARSVAGDPSTVVVDKGRTTQTILAAPEGPGHEATVSTPQ